MMLRIWLVLFLPWLLAACSTSPAAPAREMFDETTGSTVTVVSQPLVFARERTDVAAHARDYVTLVAVEIDQSGTFKDFLLLYRWSTVDKRMAPLPNAEAVELRLTGEGRVIELKPLPFLPLGLESNHNLYLPSHGAAVVRAFQVDQSLLRFIAASGALTVQLPQEPFDTPFVIWDDGRPALRVFLEQTSAP